MAEIAVGEDRHFGRGRAGDVKTLRLLSGRYGFRVTAVPPILRDGERVSSTRIREAVRAADFLQAAGMLGRPYRWRGPVIHGRQLGRLLDYPTGQYEARLRIAASSWRLRRTRPGERGGIWGVANLGCVPTVWRYRGEPLLGNAFIRSAGDIYGEKWKWSRSGPYAGGWTLSLEELKNQLPGTPPMPLKR